MSPHSIPPVVFVGAGPGRADLITLRGADRLKQAEVVLFDSLADPALRRNLPAGFANPGFDADTAAAEFAGLMQRVAAQAEFGPALAMMRDRFMAGQVPRRPGQAQQLAGLGQLTPASRAAARPDLVWQLEAHEDQVSLACGPTVLTLPGFTADAVRAALGSTSFTVGDLPGPLDEDGKVALTRRLIRDGLVQAL